MKRVYFPLLLVLVLIVSIVSPGARRARGAPRVHGPLQQGIDAIQAAEEWTWVDGAKTINQAGVYGSEDVADPANVPGARYNGASWRRAGGGLWLFGGLGYGTGSPGRLNDLWHFNPATGQWAWVDGAKTINQAGVYGSEDVADPANVPGAREGAVSWTDGSGRLWLFGGEGYDAASNFGFLNDLWRFDPATGHWTWVDGSAAHGQSGIYGSEDTPDAANVPGSRMDALSWRDQNGRLWLFGGHGLDGSGNEGELNDLWRFDPASGHWTWIDGAAAHSQAGVYGDEDVAGANNVPGARSLAVSWIDSADRLWLFGGYGYDGNGNTGDLNDLWRFDPGTGQWTWTDGSGTHSQTGMYGSEDVAGPYNVPGARESAISWIDSGGHLWLFGGYQNQTLGGTGALNDLWRFNPTSGYWTWVDGASTLDQAGVYGTEDVAGADNVPGARRGALSWRDGTGHLWLFGGLGEDGNGDGGNLNDLWRFTLQPAQLGDAVWNDVDGDGVQDPGENGLNGVTVNLYPDLDGDGLAEPGGDDGAAVATTITANAVAGDGAYSFADIAAGDYFVAFRLPAGYLFSPGDQGADDQSDSDADPATGLTAVFSLAPGSSDLSWDAGFRTFTFGATRDGSGLSLSWAVAGPDTFWVCQTTNAPYGDGTQIGSGNGSFSVGGALGDIANNYSYYLASQSDCVVPDGTKRVGEFDFGLTAGS